MINRKTTSKNNAVMYNLVFKVANWNKIKIDDEETLTQILIALENGIEPNDLRGNVFSNHFSDSVPMLEFSEEFINPKENDNQSTIEVYYEGNLIWNNVNKHTKHNQVMNNPFPFEIKIQSLSPNFKMPEKAYDHPIGYDCFAASIELIENINDYVEKITYGLGFALEPPVDMGVYLYPRSSIHKKHMLLCNGVGVGDPDYRGEYKAVFYRFKNGLSDVLPYVIGDKIIQMVIHPKYELFYNPVLLLSSTDRGTGGFGSSDGKV